MKCVKSYPVLNIRQQFVRTPYLNVFRIILHWIAVSADVAGTTQNRLEKINVNIRGFSVLISVILS